MPFHTPVVIVPIVAKFGIEVILLCATPVTVVALVAVPSKFATTVPAVPLNTLLLSVASGIKVNLPVPVSYTHLRAHETSLHLVCRLLLEKTDSAARIVGSRDCC